MSLRNKLLASRLNVATEDFEESSEATSGAVQDAVDKVADKIIEAAAEKAVEKVESEDTSTNTTEESAEEETSEGDESESEGDEGEAELDSGAEEILELNEEGDAVDEEEEAAEETADIAEGLESIALAMESTIAHGGLTPMAAQGYHIATEAYCARAGLANAIPSMESFGGSGSRIYHTQISVENIREKASQAIKALIEMLIKARDMAMAFFKKLFSFTGKIKGKAQSVAKSAEGLSGSKKESLTGELTNGLTVGGKVPNDIGAELAKLNTLLDEAYKYSDESVGYAEAVKSGLAGVDSTSDEKFTNGVKALIEKASKSAPDFKPASSDYRGNETGGKGVVGKETATHLGEVKVIAVRLADANIDQATAIRALSSQRNTVMIGESKGGDNAPTLSKEAIQSIASEVIKMMDIIDSYKESFNKVDKAIVDLTKSGKTFERAASKAEGLSKENKAMVNSLTMIIKSVPPVVSQPAQKLSQHAMNVSRAALKYCVASIKAYGKGGQVAKAE